MICPKCGSAIAENSHFCQFCGEKVVQPEPMPEPAAESPAPAEDVLKRHCVYCGAEMSMNDTVCPTCGDSGVNIDELHTEKTPDAAETSELPEQPCPPDAQEQPYSPDMQTQPYAPAQQEQPYVPNMQVQPFPMEQQFPQQYGAPQQPQYVQSAAPQMYGNMQYPQQYAQPMPQQMYPQSGQMPYAQQPQYGGYPTQQPVYPGAVNPAGETPNIPAAIIILLADIALAVSFFLNMLFGTVGYGGKAELSLFRLYEYFGQAIEAVKTIFELIGKSGVELDKINFGQIFPGELWIAVGITSAVYILFLISFINVIVAIVRVFTARGPRVTYFWGSAGAVAGTAFSAYLIAFGGCILFNLRASGILDGITGAKYKEVIGVNWLFYVMLGISFAAIILAGVMKSNAKSRYMTTPGPYRTGVPPQTNMYR